MVNAPVLLLNSVVTSFVRVSLMLIIHLEYNNYKKLKYGLILIQLYRQLNYIRDETDNQIFSLIILPINILCKLQLLYE